MTAVPRIRAGRTVGKRRANLVAQRSDQGVDRRLARRIVGLERDRRATRERSDQQHAPFALCAHHRQHAAQHAQHTEEVGLELRARVLVPSQLDTSTLVYDVLAPLAVFSTFADFPRKPSPSFAPQSLLYPATFDGDEKLLFAIARIDTSGALNQVRYTNEDLALLSSATGKFTNALAAASGDAMGVSGGQAFVYFSERSSLTETSERLHQVRVQCTN